MGQNKIKTDIIQLVSTFFCVGCFFLFLNPAHALTQVENSADLVVGQQNFNEVAANQGGSPTARTQYFTNGAFSDGNHLFIGDYVNYRVLIFNHIPTENNAAADVVIGQPDMASGNLNQGGAVGANTLGGVVMVWSDGEKMIICDDGNNRVLIFNHIPTANNTPADVVIGQADMENGLANRGGAVGANTLKSPYGVHFDGRKLFINDSGNNRLLIYNSLPTSNGASADVVIGQADMEHNAVNRGGSVAGNTLAFPIGIYSDGTKFFVADFGNNRALIYNQIPTENGASADVVIGQADMDQNAVNHGGAVGPNTLSFPFGISSDGEHLAIADGARILIFKSIPTENDPSADAVLGQADFTHNASNRGGAAGANTLSMTAQIQIKNNQLFAADVYNSRVLLFNLGPHAESLSTVSATTSRDITLTLFATEAKDMMISENPSFTGASWESYTTTKDWTLSTGDGTKTVYAKFRDFANFAGSTVSQAVTYDTTSPAVSDNLSGTTLPPGTISRVLTLTTSENSTCRYSTNQNDSFSQMTAFSATGGATHTTTLSGLEDGASYTYYIKCQDALLNTKDYQTSFSLATSNFAPTIAIGDNKIYNLSPQETVSFRVKNLYFRGKIASLKYGKVEIYEDGTLKKTTWIKNSQRWRVKLKQKDADQLRAYQFKYFNSHSEEILTSNTYNIFIDRLKPHFTDLPRKITKNPGDMVYWQATDNDQLKYYQYTFRGRRVKTNDPQFILPNNLPKGISHLTVRAYDRAENKSVRRVRVRVR